MPAAIGMVVFFWLLVPIFAALGGWKATLFPLSAGAFFYLFAAWADYKDW